ncbi:MAG: hypothetical protein GF364_12805 [Candidatus Lokiarchaeota archaeon]|nr:hypothetical protein [Candidatus Lokiarchaeota archaeon]
MAIKEKTIINQEIEKLTKLKLPEFKLLLILDKNNQFIGILDENYIIKKQNMASLSSLLNEIYNEGKLRITPLDDIIYDNTIKVYKTEQVNNLCDDCRKRSLIYGIKIADKGLFCLHSFCKEINGNIENYRKVC